MTQHPQNPPEMARAYEPGKIEQKWYRFWLEKGYFKPVIDASKKPFVIIMPPPNVTGRLHIGHALTAALEDIMTRWHRMKGEPTLWLPGVDHAGIAAQVVVEKVLAAEGLDRHKLGKEKFQERVWQWAAECRRHIREQHERLGTSCDWSRETFTLDPGPSRATRTAFVRLYDKGLIYRGERIINWCPRCATALSDLEVYHQEIQGDLWYVRYPLAGVEGYVTVATTRPETILGDTAVAVNPDDERYRHLVGKELVLPVLKRIIPIVADEAIDPAFGTGAVKVTPAHDPVDFEIAQRHNLPLINILNRDATMNENAGPYAGMDRFACRKAIVEDLEKAGLLEKIVPYTHSVGHCDRCRTIIEPLASKQWFVRTQPLAAPAIKAVNEGRIKILPDHFTRVYLNWMENIRDWCISRQLWWGHRIPVWYCADCDKLTVSVETPAKCDGCGSDRLEQDPDVLDTWFSSALWTHSTLGWPDDTEDLRYFYPTSVMETGYDILFFWVARMVMMGIEDMGEIPFHTVYLHGLVRDEKGEKMSKVRGNVLDPVELLAKYGADALRLALSTGTSPGSDVRVAQPKLEASRNFANKLWNAARFVIRNLENAPAGLPLKNTSGRVEDRWILSYLNRTIAGANRLMEDYQFGEAEKQIHDFLWGDFCDWYIELSKIPRAANEGSPLPVLVHTLETSLRLLHPFMPFITEELWQALKSSAPDGAIKGDSVMMAAYPVSDDSLADPEAVRIIDALIEIVRAIRNVRAENRVEPARWIEARVFAGELAPALTAHKVSIETLARVRPLTFLAERPPAREPNALTLVLKGSQVVIPLPGMVDAESEKKRLAKEIGEMEADISRLESRLKDEAFLAKAPPQIVAKEQERLATRKDRLQRLREQLEG